MPKLRVGVLFGGRSVEHDVSLVSARAIMAALDPARYDVIPLAITKAGAWLPPAQAQRLLAAEPLEPGAGITAVATVGDSASTPLGAVDVVFPVVHGTMGEDGTVQGLLELADVPYVGAGVLGSALGMDKAMMKVVFQASGLPVAPYLTVSRHDWQSDAAAMACRIGSELGYPCFVKPSNGGSSVGISKVHHAGELAAAMDLALHLDRRAVVEQAILARELECAVLGNDEPQASVVGEILPAREFYDYEAKYFDDRTQLRIPADIPAAVAERVRALAVQAFVALDCAGMARVDFFLSKDDGPLFINEINTIPGFTPTSMYPRMWQASGLSYAALVDRLVELALERFAEKQQTAFTYPALPEREG